MPVQISGSYASGSCSKGFCGAGIIAGITIAGSVADALFLETDRGESIVLDIIMPGDDGVVVCGASCRAASIELSKATTPLGALSFCDLGRST